MGDVAPAGDGGNRRNEILLLADLDLDRDLGLDLDLDLGLRAGGGVASREARRVEAVLDHLRHTLPLLSPPVDSVIAGGDVRSGGAAARRHDARDVAGRDAVRAEFDSHDV